MIDRDEMRILTFTKLFPNCQAPEHGIFVAKRVEALARVMGHEIRVVAPIPYYPAFLPAVGEWKRLREVPGSEMINSLEVYHPRYFNPPRVGMSRYGEWMAMGSRPTIRKLWDEGFHFDLIDSHFAYPDSYAAIKIGRQFRRPVAVTVRGSDVMRNREIPAIAPLLRRVAAEADQLVAVSEELRDQLIDLGGLASKIRVIPNGIDGEVFHRLDAGQARQILGLDQEVRWIIAVARLDRNKGQRLLVDALSRIGRAELKRRNIRVALIGSGEDRRALENKIRASLLEDVVLLTGQLPPERLRYWYNVAEMNVLPSFREGSPNAVLEALACGTPIVASKAGRNPVTISDGVNGLLFEVGSVDGLSNALLRALESNWDRDEIASRAGERTWDVVAREVDEVFCRTVQEFNRR